MKSIKRFVAVLLLSVSMLSAAEFVVDGSHSHVAFSVKHMMISNVKGEFKEFDADIDFDPKTMKFNALSATVDANSIDTGIVKRDNHLRSEDFFFAKKYPQLTFKMLSYQGDKEEGKMSGELTMRGVTKRVIFDVELGGVIKDLRGNTRVGFTLSGKVNRKDFGLNWNKVIEAGGVAVGDKVKIIVDVEAMML